MSLHIVISAPTGYNARELLQPLAPLLTTDASISRVTVITPAASVAREVFRGYGSKFFFVANPKDQASHNQLLKNLQPSVVVTPTSGLDDKDTPILTAARESDYRTYTFVASWDNVYKMERFKQFGKLYVLADHLAVWNQMMRDHLLRIFPQLLPEQISIVGSPRLDVFAKTDGIPSRRELFEYLQLPYDGGKLLHIATTELYPMEYIVKTIRRAVTAGKLPRSTHLYASVHPGGDMSKHDRYATKYNVKVRYSFGRRNNAPLPEFLYNPTPSEAAMLVALFRHADVLINHSSTVALESMLADTPVINVKYGQPLDWWRWYRSMVYRDFQQHYADIVRGGGTTIVTRPRDLIAAVATYLDHPEHKRQERRETMENMITYTDGSASRRLLDSIKTTAVG